METKPFLELVKWMDTIQQRSAVERGVNVPEKFTMKEKLKTKDGGDTYAKEQSSWIMKGMKEDQEKHK